MLTIMFIIIMFLWFFGLIPYLLYRQDKKQDEEDDKEEQEWKLKD